MEWNIARLARLLPFWDAEACASLKYQQYEHGAAFGTGAGAL